MPHVITCPSGLTGRVRGMKVREERILADRKLAKSGTEVPYYRCTRTYKLGWNACPLKQVNADWIERRVETMLKELSASPDLVEKAVSAANASSAEQAAPLREKERALQERLREVKLKLKNLVEIVASQGPSAFDSFRESIAQGEKERAHVGAELALLREEIARLTTKLVDPERAATVLRSFYLLFHLATPAEKRELLHLLLKKIEFQGRDKPITLELFDLRSLEHDGSKLRPDWLREGRIPRTWRFAKYLDSFADLRAVENRPLRRQRAADRYLAVMARQSRHLKGRPCPPMWRLAGSCDPGAPPSHRRASSPSYDQRSPVELGSRPKRQEPPTAPPITIPQPSSQTNAPFSRPLRESTVPGQASPYHGPSR